MTAVHHPVALPQQPALGAGAAEVPVGTAAARRVLSLPMSPWLNERDQNRVIEALAAEVAGG